MVMLVSVLVHSCPLDFDAAAAMKAWGRPDRHQVAVLADFQENVILTVLAGALGYFQANGIVTDLVNPIVDVVVDVIVDAVAVDVAVDVDVDVIVDAVADADEDVNVVVRVAGVSGVWSFCDYRTSYSYESIQRIALYY